MSAAKLVAAVQDYLADLGRIRASGGGTDERSFYPPLTNLLNAVGGSLRPRVFCVSELAQQGAGHPDLGLYAAKQVQRGQPRKGQTPECGVVEVKAAHDDAWLTAESVQVSGYLGLYRLVLVTNTRDFVLLGEDAQGTPARLETFRLAQSAADFDAKLKTPRSFARAVGPGLAEYLGRALSHRATIVEPRDLAWLLASYARDGLSRVEAAGDAPSLNAVRSALEEALGVKFEGERGAAFFRSTLVQTLFYGVFSAWVLWSRGTPPPTGPFDWRTADWYLKAPVLGALFRQLASPTQLESIGLVEVLDWAASALDRVDRGAFFDRFNEGEAVPYFYEPFLEAFDPALRKQLGVWYTPAEVVRYMVARVDRALKDDLGIAGGLADERVYVLDPCCGTGAYLAEVLRRIAENLEGSGLGALTGARVKQAATQRVFGFEIMPAPFVVAHLQVGLMMRALDAPLSEDVDERAGVFLTNALTGWEPTVHKPVPFPELEEERKRADRVKQDSPILVILGNPPYNGFAGMAVDEERELSTAYRTTKLVRSPEGQGLNDLYVRFFRMAERRIAEKSGRGVVCFISNYSWLDGLSFTGMREHYLEAFDAIRIDNLNGDKYRTGKTTPDGEPDPSIFSTPEDPVGIQVGTAITTLVRKADRTPAKAVGFRHLWGQTKREELAASAVAEPEALYDSFEPSLLLGLPFARVAVSDGWHDWPALPDLFPVSFPGVKTSRDSFLVDVDLDRLKSRLADYFNPEVTHEEIARRYPIVMSPTARFDPLAVRRNLRSQGGVNPAGFVRYAYRPFDVRWLYWEAETKLLDEKRAEYKSHVFEGNLWLVLQNKARPDLSPPLMISGIGDLNQMNSGVYCVPTLLSGDILILDSDEARTRPNLSPTAQRYLDRLGAGAEDLFHHVLGVLHAPVYRDANADALRAEGPRIPLPGWPEGDKEGAAEELATSAARGRELAALLDSETPVSGVTAGPLRSRIAALAVPSTVDGGNMAGDDFALTAGWGHFGQGQAVMPGQGRVVERPCTAEELAALGGAASASADTTFDVYLNDRAYWRNVPVQVWSYKLGGYQVLKKWLSYREHGVLGRAMRPEEVQHFTDTARRIAAILEVVEK
ncbi:MAG: N-6 DNA methylase [Dehalococcoidia bacterium]|nr:N-6 DNA methylase [Dehalococcoidia bacterium]